MSIVDQFKESLDFTESYIQEENGKLGQIKEVQSMIETSRLVEPQDEGVSPKVALKSQISSSDSRDR